MRTCSICIKHGRPMADCPHPGHEARAKAELMDRPDIVYCAGFSVSLPPVAIVEQPAKPTIFRVKLIGIHCPMKCKVSENGEYLDHIPFTDDEVAVLRPLTWQEAHQGANLDEAQDRGNESLALVTAGKVWVQ